jgi:peptidyl-prolyl cis-trans isomerase SurA
MRLSAILVLVLVLAAIAAPAPNAATVELDRIVALVNDDVILKSELNQRMRTVVEQLRQQGTSPPPLEVLQKQVLERLIVNRLQLQLAEENGIRVDDNTLNRTLRNIAGRNKLSLSEFKSILERDGYDFSAFREDIREELILTQLRERQVENRIKVTEREVDDFLLTQAVQSGGDDQYRLGHILIAVPEAPSPEQIAAARAKGEKILQELSEGADFSQLAVAVSDGQQALEGGDLGWRKVNELPTLFAEVVLQMQPGDVSDLIRSPSGFHIVKLLEVRRSERLFITQTHARHILITPDELTSDTDAKIRLQQIKTRVENGEDFAALARAHSEDAGTAVNGGDLGWVSPGDVVPQFQAAMDNLEPGQISDPFRSPFGWHIVQVLERRDRDSTEQVRRTRAKELIRQRKLEEEVQSWLRRLRDEAYVDYRL